MLQKCCQKSWQNFWKTVIFGNICQIWHHQATLHMRRLSSNELCEHFDGVLFFIQSLLHLILAYKKLKSFSHKHSRFVFNQTHISWWRPNPPCLTKDLKYGYDALFKQSLPTYRDIIVEYIHYLYMCDGNIYFYCHISLF